MATSVALYRPGPVVPAALEFCWCTEQGELPALGAWACWAGHPHAGSTGALDMCWGAWWPTGLPSFSVLHPFPASAVFLELPRQRRVLRQSRGPWPARHGVPACQACARGGRAHAALRYAPRPDKRVHSCPHSQIKRRSGNNLGSILALGTTATEQPSGVGELCF